jgi:hypothetical protein
MQLTLKNVNCIFCMMSDGGMHENAWLPAPGGIGGSVPNLTQPVRHEM